MSTNPYAPPKNDDPCAHRPPARRNWRDHASEYNAAFGTALILQISIGVIVSLVLDGGQMLRAFGVAFLGQWAMVAIMLLRRPLQPTKLDLLIVRYGIFPLLIVVIVFGPHMIRAFGLEP